MSNEIKIGIIGCGWATENLHVPALRRVGRYRIMAVADIDGHRSESFAGRMGIEQWFNEPSQLIEHPEVEAIAVCVPPDNHVSLAIAALDAGKHVFIEKPMALTMDQADRLVAVAKLSKAKVLVGFNLRWHRLVRECRQMLDAKAIGPLIAMRTTFTNALLHNHTSPVWRKDRACGGGVIYDLAVHHFDLWRFLLSSEVQELSVSCRSDDWHDEAAVISARMTNGILVSSVFAHGTTDDHQLELYGSQGKLHVSLYRHDGLQHSLHGGNRMTKLFQRLAGTTRTLPAAIAALRNGGEIFASYDAQWRHFYDCMRAGARIDCTIEDGRRAVELSVAAVESSQMKRSINMNLSSVGGSYD
jgi:myo-inositol 2-dehydrogenase/D-chiro-inositol 1-dehydrogenase